MKYIPVDKLIAEIDKKWKELADKNVKVGGGKWDAEISTYLSVLNLIDSLQQEQPKVDLLKEIRYQKAILLDDIFGPMNGEQSFAIKNFAYHFYELGKNLQKNK